MAAAQLAILLNGGQEFFLSMDCSKLYIISNYNILYVYFSLL